MAKFINNTECDISFEAEGCEPDRGELKPGEAVEVEAGDTIFEIAFLLKEPSGQSTITISS